MKKSAAAICPMWSARNARQVCDGGLGVHAMYFATVV
jgi:hypothetical protein